MCQHKQTLSFAYRHIRIARTLTHTLFVFCIEMKMTISFNVAIFAASNGSSTTCVVHFRENWNSRFPLCVYCLVNYRLQLKRTRRESKLNYKKRCDSSQFVSIRRFVILTLSLAPSVYRSNSNFTHLAFEIIIQPLNNTVKMSYKSSSLIIKRAQIKCDWGKIYLNSIDFVLDRVGLSVVRCVSEWSAPIHSELNAI